MSCVSEARNATLIILYLVGFSKMTTKGVLCINSKRRDRKWAYLNTIPRYRALLSSEFFCWNDRVRFGICNEHFIMSAKRLHATSDGLIFCHFYRESSANKLCAEHETCAYDAWWSLHRDNEDSSRRRRITATPSLRQQSYVWADGFRGYGVEFGAIDRASTNGKHVDIHLFQRDGCSDCRRRVVRHPVCDYHAHLRNDASTHTCREKPCSNLVGVQERACIQKGRLQTQRY